MLDVEPLIRQELRDLSPSEAGLAGDWEAIVVAAGITRRRPPLLRGALALAVVLAVVVPAVAFSAGVRGLLGFQSPSPRFDEARLVASDRLPDGRVVRMWTSPSTQNGECWFVTYGRAGSGARPDRATSGGQCSVGAARLRFPGLTYEFAVGRGNAPTVISGRFDPARHPARVTIRWRGGRRTVKTGDGYFVAAVPEMANPRFTSLPFDLVVSDSTGRHLTARRIPTSFLYINWKHVEPQLRRYRIGHGCIPSPPWHCRTR
jgi:hypothetical protein